ncbi:MAG TPA: deoxyguanosinetriphosphate triphosphohydrolase [Polyangiaceae bacterium]|nr:deoxyguanosinetriphosphate triphosphohydrolase [Polyangiaceae bacterium]
MDWLELLCRKRVSHTGEVWETPRELGRSPFERDWDRILFSAAFRRMHDKTQVFPLPDDDVVHSRLTHSLEVASVGRSLGQLVGRTVCERHAIDHERGFDFHDVGDVVAAACLAHDIGNPPFGHAGEDAIAMYFRSAAGASAVQSLSERERADFESFEGNAQGFRLLTRLQLEVDGGLQLTAAALAAFSKYPREAGVDLRQEGRTSRRKHGLFQSDTAVFEVVARETGLHPTRSASGGRAWCRHPLAFLVEAADDICFSVLDIEDGVRLRVVDANEAETLLLPIARKAKAFSTERLQRFMEPKLRISYLRAIAISAMIEECVGAFLDVEPSILNGSFDTSLADSIASRAELKALRELARSRCYNAAEVIEIELAGYEALGGLLEHFVPAVLSAPEDTRRLPERDQKSLRLLRGRSVETGEPALYTRLLRVTDFVSGMTDRHALATYRRLKGIALPGRAG